MTPVLQSILSFIEAKGTSIIVSLFALVFGIMIIKNLMKIIKMAVIGSKLDKSMFKLVLSVIQFLLYFLLVVYILSKMGIGITGLVAIFSAFSLAIGLAIQDVIGGLANGLVIISTKPFKVGDFVQIGDISGTIKEINIMHTVLDSPDKQHIFLPNKTVYNSSIQNFTTNPVRRLDYEAGVDFSADHYQVKELFTKVLNQNPYVLKNPAPQVMVNEVGSNEIVYKLRCWVMNNDYWTLHFELREQILMACRENNIGLAFPQITLSQREPIVIKQEESK